MHELEGIPMREVEILQDNPLFTAYTRLRTARRNLTGSIGQSVGRDHPGWPRHVLLASGGLDSDKKIPWQRSHEP